MPRNINYNMSSVSLIYQWHCLIAYHCQIIINIFPLPLYNKSVFWINAYSIMLLRSVHMRMREFIVNVSLQKPAGHTKCPESCKMERLSTLCHHLALVTAYRRINIRLWLQWTTAGRKEHKPWTKYSVHVDDYRGRPLLNKSPVAKALCVRYT